VDTTYIQISQKNLHKFEEEKSQVLFKASSSPIWSQQLTNRRGKVASRSLDKLAVKALDLRKSGADWYLQKQHIQ